MGTVDGAWRGFCGGVTGATEPTTTFTNGVGNVATAPWSYLAVGFAVQALPPRSLRAGGAHAAGIAPDQPATEPAFQCAAVVRGLLRAVAGAVPVRGLPCGERRGDACGVAVVGPRTVAGAWGVRVAARGPVGTESAGLDVLPAAQVHVLRGPRGPPPGNPVGLTGEWTQATLQHHRNSTSLVINRRNQNTSIRSAPKLPARILRVACPQIAQQSHTASRGPRARSESSRTP
jgi:hypothetical protein